MNLSDLENQLRTLKPVKPSAELEQAIARELAHALRPATAGVIPRGSETPGGRLLSGLCWAFGGAAVAVIATVCIYASQTVPAADAPLAATVPPGSRPIVFEPVAASREFMDAEAGELVYAEDNAPARVVTYRSRERHVWTNPSTGAQVELEVPRQDVMLVPVSFQ